MYNFHLKEKRMLRKLVGEISAITEKDEKLLFDPNGLDVESPEYFTESFSVFNQLLDKALLGPSDIQQIESYLQGLAQGYTFKWRKATNKNGQVVSIVWQSGVMRLDFELYGSTSFLDRLGLNKGWPADDSRYAVRGEDGLSVLRRYCSRRKCDMLC
jgi:hypothetical protein